jgi:hypothetical protein
MEPLRHYATSCDHTKLGFTVLAIQGLPPGPYPFVSWRLAISSRMCFGIGNENVCRHVSRFPEPSWTGSLACPIGVYQDLSGSPMHLIGWHRHAQRCGRDGKQSQDWVFRRPTDDGNESNANTFW